MTDENSEQRPLQESYIQKWLDMRQRHGDETALAVFLSDLRHELSAIINTNRVMGMLLENEEVATEILDGIETIDTSGELALEIMDAFRVYSQRLADETSGNGA